MQNLLELIRQRKIDRVAAAYGVAAWLVVQAAAITFPTFDAPAWVLKVLIVGAIIGFPVTLWIAWHVTPAPHAGRYPAPPPSKATDIALLALLAGVVLFSGVEIAAQTGLLPGVAKRGVAPAATSVRVPDQPPPRTSIAVLPFVNMSGDAAKEYFSDGISEELLNQLASTPALRVAAQTSSFAFKGTNEDIRSIARELNVGAVLEGSVREDGQHVRITAQLINAADGFQLWSQTYDRDLSNILQVQDDIARAIIASLTHGYLGNTANPEPNHSPIDPQAYREYLQGQALSGLKTVEDDAKAINLFTAVTETEPKFAPAYAALGRTYIHSAEFQDRRADYVAAAEAALNRALVLDPGNLEALATHLALALMKWEWDAAAADASRLKALNPHSLFTLGGLNAYYSSLGFPEQQAAVLREATRLDPLSFVDLNNLATVYNDRGEYAEAESAASDALTLRPDRVLTLYTLCSAYVGMKRASRAQILVDHLAALGAIDASQACALQNAAQSGRKAEAHTLADNIAARFPAFVFGETDIGTFYLAAGDVSRAIVWFGRAYDKRDDQLFAIPYKVAIPPVLLKSPGWIALNRKPEARAWQATHDRLLAELSSN